MTGALTMAASVNLSGMDINLRTGGASTDDSGDIVYYYGNGREKARIWTLNDFTNKFNGLLNYRSYSKEGSSIMTTQLATLLNLNVITTTIPDRFCTWYNTGTRV